MRPTQDYRLKCVTVDTPQSTFGGGFTKKHGSAEKKEKGGKKNVRLLTSPVGQKNNLAYRPREVKKKPYRKEELKSSNNKRLRLAAYSFSKENLRFFKNDTFYLENNKVMQRPWSSIIIVKKQ